MHAEVSLAEKFGVWEGEFGIGWQPDLDKGLCAVGEAMLNICHRPEENRSQLDNRLSPSVNLLLQDLAQEQEDEIVKFYECSKDAKGFYRPLKANNLHNPSKYQQVEHVRCSQLARNPSKQRVDASRQC